MRYQNLRKNDVLFCESKGSRVLKLVEKVEGSWVGRDIFTNQNFELNNTDQVITKAQIERIIESLTTLDWQINIESHISKKHSVKKEKHSSLVIAHHSLNDAFNAEGVLLSPISFFVRGDSKGFVDSAYKQALLVFKVTDYKSIVKFHGEFIIAPNNNFTNIPEFII